MNFKYVTYIVLFTSFFLKSFRCRLWFLRSSQEENKKAFIEVIPSNLKWQNMIQKCLPVCGICNFDNWNDKGCGLSVQRWAGLLFKKSILAQMKPTI